MFPIACAALALSLNTQQPDRPGYTDGPTLPGQHWRVHDSARPYPPVVDSGPESGPAPVPSDAVVLLDGSSLDAWERSGGGPAGWKLDGEGMTVMPGTGDIQTHEGFGDCHLHVEWATASPGVGESQHRCNSGVFMMGRYEIQILDSFQNDTYADGQAAALYGQYPPLVNACRAPGEWQTFDIYFQSPRFHGDVLERPAYVTVIHNGVPVHIHQEMYGVTQHRALATYSPHEPTGPIKLQDHGNPVRFRNIWVRPLTSYDAQPEGH